MGAATALRVAIDLVQVPARVRRIRSAPLPDGMEMLLRVAAGDVKAISEAAELTRRPPDFVKEAARFFIEQILLCPDADSYRVLGAGPEATGAELRRNMALLMRWLHPDVEQAGDRSVFAGRVTRAWGDLKSSERRAAYDARCASRGDRPHHRDVAQTRAWSGKQTPKRHFGNGVRPPSGKAGRSLYVSRIYRTERMGLLRRALLFLFGTARY